MINAEEVWPPKLFEGNTEVYRVHVSWIGAGDQTISSTLFTNRDESGCTLLSALVNDIITVQLEHTTAELLPPHQSL